MSEAVGTFEITMTPQGDALPISHFTLQKSYTGPMIASSTGHMLAYRSETDGSAGYVAMESVEGILDGRRGSFVLQHTGLMDRGEPSLSVVVVPDSGTNELAGIAGSLTIDIKDGVHHYVLIYNLP
jgi:Protein of unknown function (DUF3224)